MGAVTDGGDVVQHRPSLRAVAGQTPVSDDEAQASLACWLRRLPLDEWRVTLQLADETELGGDGEIDVCTDFQYATIVLRRDVRRDRLDTVIVHELCHLLLTPVCDCAYDVVEGYVPKSSRQFVRRRLYGFENSAVQRTARALLRAYGCIEVVL